MRSGRAAAAISAVAMVGCLAAAPCTSANDGSSVRYVDDDALLPGPGTSWGSAFGCLQDALVAAAFDPSISEIRVAQGLYRPDEGAGYEPGDTQASFLLLERFVIRGGFAGVGAPDPDARDIELYTTTLSGDLSRGGAPLHSRHVLRASGVSPATILDGVTVEGGVASGPGDDDDRGGGLHAVHADLTISNCTFRDNVAGSPDEDEVSRGGAAYFVDGCPVLVDCTFLNNRANVGGGVFFHADPSAPPNAPEGEITLLRCHFVGNSTWFNDWSGGGGALWASTVLARDCTFRANAAEGFGGALGATRPTLEGCTFAENWCGRSGGAVRGSRTNVDRCSFTDNFAVEGGGAMSCTVRCVIGSAVFSGNVAGERGGAIESFSNYGLRAAFCTLIRNRAPEGGAWYHVGSGVVVRNSIIRENALPVMAGVPDTVVIHTSNVEGGFAGYGNIDADPMFVGEEGALLHLAPGSPCIDSGNPDDAASQGTDRDGAPRLVGCRVDMGAFESSEKGIDCDGNGVSDGCDLMTRGVFDCSQDAVPDQCQLTDDDCNGDGVPDACPTSIDFAVHSSHVEPFPGFLSFTVPEVPKAAGPVTFTVSGVWERVAILVNNVLVVHQFANLNCSAGFRQREFIVSASFYNSLLDGDDAWIVVHEADPCPEPYLSISIAYEADRSDVDCNANGVLDECEIAAGDAPDDNGNAVPDACDPDCNGNGMPDFAEIASGTVGDCNRNGVPDGCDIAAGTSPDYDLDGLPDACRDDCNGNGVPDYLDIAQGFSIDCDANGLPDECLQPRACICPADLSGDGVVGVEDLVAVILSWGPCDDCPADLDDDGTVGSNDLIDVIVAWGICP